jgi:hypothetical protein
MWKVARETSRPRPNWREFTKRRSEKLLGRSTIPATEGHRRADFSGISLWKTFISATLVRFKITSSPPFP